MVTNPDYQGKATLQEFALPFLHFLKYLQHSFSSDVHVSSKGGLYVAVQYSSAVCLHCLYAFLQALFFFFLFVVLASATIKWPAPTSNAVASSPMTDRLALPWALRRARSSSRAPSIGLSALNTAINGR